MKPVYLSVEPVRTGRRIRELIHRNGLNVRMVQEACGFENPQAVYKWLSGKSLPSVDNLVILSYIFHTSIDDILAVKGGDVVFCSGDILAVKGGDVVFSYFIKVLQRFSFIEFGRPA